MDVFDLSAKIKLDSSEYDAGLDKAKTGLAGIGEKATSLGSKLKTGLGMGVFMAIGQKAVTAVTSSFSGFLGGMDKMNTAWKNFESNMIAAGHSTAEIEKAKGEMQEFASQSQYYSSAMAATYAQLDAVGVKGTSDLVKGLGGIAAASAEPQQAMESLSTQAMQMAARPTVAWGDFQVMLQQSPAGMAEVARQMGMTTNQLVAQVQAGQVSTEQLFGAMKQIGSDGSNELMKAATTYKSIGDAGQGVIGYLQAQLAPAFDVFSQKAISSITGIFNVIASIDKEGLANWVDKLLSADSVGAAFDMIAVTIQEKMPTVMNTILGGIESLLGQIASAAPSFVNIAGNLITGFVNGIASHIPTIIAKGLELVQNLATGIINNIPQLLVAGLNLVQGLIKGIGDNIGKLPAMALKLVVALAKGIWNNKGKIVSAAFKLVMAIPKAIVNAVGSFISTGAKLIKSLWNGAKDKLSGLPEKAYNWVAKIPSRIKDAVSDFLQAGLDLIQGLWDGIKEKFSAVSDWVAEHSKGLGATTRKALDENSPSKLFRKIGYMIPEGMALGIQDGWGLVGNAMDGMLDQTDVEDAFVPTDGAFEESFQINMGNTISAVVESIIPVIADSMAEAMEEVTIQLDKRQFGKMTRKAVANAL